MTAGNKPDTVVFDVGNVLVEFNPESFLLRETADETIRARLLKAVFKNPHGQGVYAWKTDNSGLGYCFGVNPG